MTKSREVHESSIGRRFTLQTLLAYVACIAFLLVLAKWALSEFPEAGIKGTVKLIVTICPWAVGSFIGIARSVQTKRSPIWGAMVGGCLGAAVFPILPCMYLFFRGLNAVDASTVTPQIIAAVSCSFAMGSVFSGCRWVFDTCASYVDLLEGS